jgi:drug/metabolite transporter (DMT)-like permease
MPTPADDPIAARNRALAPVAVAGAVLTWGCSNVLIKATTTTGLVASFYRLWFAIPLLWGLCLAIPSVRRRLGRQWLSGALLGGALFGLHQVLFFSSLKLTTVADVSLIGALQPPLVLVVAGRWFGERVSTRVLGFALVGVVGAALVVFGAQGAPGWSPVGDLIAVGNLFAFTAYFLASKHIRASSGTAEYLLGMTTVAGLVMLCVCLLTGQDLGSPHGSDWLLLLTLAVFPGTIGHFLTNWAHPHTSAFVVSIMFLAVPVLATAGAAVFLGEAVGPLQLVGGAVVLLSVTAVVAAAPRRAGEELAESVAETDAP